MPHAFWEAIAETPWWLYLLLIGVFMIAYKATKPRVVAVKPIFVANCITNAILLFAYFYITEFTVPQVLLLLASFAAGIFLGKLQFHFSKIKAIKNKPQVYIPGSWTFFVLISMILAAKYYYFGHSYQFDAAIFKQEKYAYLLTGLVGLSVGLFIGRMRGLLLRLKNGPFSDTASH